MTLEGARVLVVGAGAFQLDLLRTAKRLGAKVATADRNANAPGFEVADVAWAIDILDVEALVAAARAFEPDGVVTAASDAALPSVVGVARALGLPSLPPEALANCRDKLRTSRVLDARGLGSPETWEVHDADETRAAIDSIGGFPIVVKPRAAAGGRGVSIVSEPGGLDEAVARASKYARPGDGVLVQRFVGGLAVGAEVFMRAGDAISTVLMNDQFQPGFVSPIGHSLPSRLAVETQQAVSTAVKETALALGVGDGPLNLDLRLEQDRVVVIEVNARLGGNSITELVRRATGADLEHAALLSCLGRDPSPALAQTYTLPVASRLLLVEARGRVHLPAEIDVAEGETLDLAVRDGEELALRVDDFGIVGRCLVEGADSLDAEKRAERLGARVLDGLEVSS